MTDALRALQGRAPPRPRRAAQRGRFDEALAAYQEAGTIAPDRAMPQSSIGGVLARLGRTAQALAAYDAALEPAPADEAALRGRAERAGDGSAAGPRRPTPSTAWWSCSDEAGRLSDAADAASPRPRARRIAQPTPGPSRSLAGRLREAGGHGRGRCPRRRRLGIEPGADSPAAAPEPKPRRRAARSLSAAAVLTAAADTALDTGDREEARRCYLEAAAAQRSIGHLDAALDACYLALADGAGRGRRRTSRSRSSTSTAAGGRRPRTSCVLLGRLTDARSR